MLRDFLTINLVDANVIAKNWQDAIFKVGNLLVNSRKIKIEYINDIINNVHNLGPYFVVIPGVAMGHAMSGENVLQDCISLIHLKDTVEFGHPANDPVRIVIVFATNNINSHLSFLQDLANMLDHGDNLNKIMEVCSKEEIFEIVRDY